MGHAPTGSRCRRSGLSVHRALSLSQPNSPLGPPSHLGNALPGRLYPDAAHGTGPCIFRPWGMDWTSWVPSHRDLDVYLRHSRNAATRRAQHSGACELDDAELCDCLLRIDLQIDLSRRVFHSPPLRTQLSPQHLDQQYRESTAWRTDPPTPLFPSNPQPKSDV